MAWRRSKLDCGEMCSWGRASGQILASSIGWMARSWLRIGRDGAAMVSRRRASRCRTSSHTGSHFLKAAATLAILRPPMRTVPKGLPTPPATTIASHSPASLFRSVRYTRQSPPPHQRPSTFTSALLCPGPPGARTAWVSPGCLLRNARKLHRKLSFLQGQRGAEQLCKPAMPWAPRIRHSPGWGLHRAALYTAAGTGRRCSTWGEA
mmetsp:Transcript_67867/g.159750  ORF Transcript_67867/g.159750 Transcript_67867/m.159750 type:complete len:207 (-) Transcript_67867:112-732(-)